VKLILIFALLTVTLPFSSFAKDQGRTLALQILGFSESSNPSQSEIKLRFAKQMESYSRDGKNVNEVLDAYRMLHEDFVIPSIEKKELKASFQATIDDHYPKNLPHVSESYYHELESRAKGFHFDGSKERSVLESVYLAIKDVKSSDVLGGDPQTTRAAFFSAHWREMCGDYDSFKYARDHHLVWLGYKGITDAIETIPESRLQFNSIEELATHHESSVVLNHFLHHQNYYQNPYEEGPKLSLNHLLSIQKNKLTQEQFYTALRKVPKRWKSYSDFGVKYLLSQTQELLHEQQFLKLPREKQMNDLLQDLVAFRKNIMDQPQLLKELDSTLITMIAGSRDYKGAVATRIAETFRNDPTLYRLSEGLSLRKEIAIKTGYCVNRILDIFGLGKK